MSQSRRILLLQGHPDGSERHLCHALAQAYGAGAGSSGHTVRQVDIAQLDFPLLRSMREWEEEGGLPAGLAQAQQDIHWAEHLVLFFPLWLGDMPALVKGFLEQVARPGFAFSREEGGELYTRRGLTGRSARLVVTMGMPSPVYRWYFGAHSLRSLERNVLRFVGVAPVRRTLVGSAGRMDAARLDRILGQMNRLGERAL